MKRRKPIRRISEKGKERRKDKMELFQDDISFYQEIWDERRHIDFETRLPIPGDFMLWYFHHVLPKRERGGYPQYRHCKWNIVLVSKATHDQTEFDMDKTPAIRAYYTRLLQLHDEGKLQQEDPNNHFIWSST